MNSPMGVSVIDIQEEMKSSYLDYAMSVIVARALPDVRDGLKPVHRRVLFAMYELNNGHDKPYKKSARVVGDVIGKYHPHGDSAVYDTIVRMAQDFSLRYPLVDGQGNFGSVDGDSAAAMRYTEIRMTKLTHTLLEDLEKDTVDWIDNYDGSEKIPDVLPTRIPNLLVNGTAGIAVGMATNMPPHNLTEIINACLVYANNPYCTDMDLIACVLGPDFPTGGIIHGTNGIIEAYLTGKGKFTIRGKYHIEECPRNGRQTIVFTEIPYQVNKAKVLERIAELVKDKKINGISELRDESDKDGMRIVIDLKRGENAAVLVNSLFVNTNLQTSFSFNMVALENGQPHLMTLRRLIAAFIRHRQEVVTRRTQYDLAKAIIRGHNVEGLAVALSNIDVIIETIKKSKSPALARQALAEGTWKTNDVLKILEKTGLKTLTPIDNPKVGPQDNGNYVLSNEQITGILELKLHRLTGLEQDKLLAEYKDIVDQIGRYNWILGSGIMSEIISELEDIRRLYGDQRKTAIDCTAIDVSRQDLIAEEQVVLTVSRQGWAKTQPLDVYAAQRRGGKGKLAAGTREDDDVAHMLVTSNHSTVLCFTTKGKVYWIKVYDIPQASRVAKGRPLVNMINLGDDERVAAILPLDASMQNKFIVMATASGTVKRVSATAFMNPRSTGVIAINLADRIQSFPEVPELKTYDQLIGVVITDGNSDVMMFSNEGKAIRFKETDIRPMGRTARGVRGMRVKLNGGIIDEAEVAPEADDMLEVSGFSNNFVSRVVTLLTVPENGEILTTCANGYGKRTKVADYPTKRRGGRGIIAIKTTERNGELISAIGVTEKDDVMLMTNNGVLIRTPVKNIALLSRNTQGVLLMRTESSESLVDVACLTDL